MPCRATSRPCHAVPWPWGVAFRKASSWHVRGAGWAWHSRCKLALRRKADRIHRTLNVIVAQSKSCTFGVNTTIQLKNMTVTSDSSGIWRGIFPPTNVPVLSHVVLILFISIVVLYFTWQFSSCASIVFGERCRQDLNDSYQYIVTEWPLVNE